MSAVKGQLIVVHDRRDRAEANRIVRKLETEGFRVARTDNAIALRRQAVDTPTVLLWSRNAPKLNNLTSFGSDTSVIVKLDSRPAPLSDAMVTDLRGWIGHDRHRGWKSLLNALTPVTTTPSGAAHAPSSAAKASAAVAQGSKPSESLPQQIVSDDASTGKKSGGVALIILGVLAVIGAAAGAAAYFLL